MTDLSGLGNMCCHYRCGWGVCTSALYTYKNRLWYSKHYQGVLYKISSNKVAGCYGKVALSGWLHSLPVINGYTRPFEHHYS